MGLMTLTSDVTDAAPDTYDDNFVPDVTYNPAPTAKDDLSMSGVTDATFQNAPTTHATDDRAFNSALAGALMTYTNPAAAEAGLGGWIKDNIKQFTSLFKDENGKTNAAAVTLAGSFLKGLMSYPQEKRAQDILQQRANNETRQTDLLAENQANKSSMGKIKYNPGAPLKFSNKRIGG